MRTRFLAIALAVTMLVFGGLVFSGARINAETATPAPQDSMGGHDGWSMHSYQDLPPVLAFLRDVPPSERFAHVREARIVMTDQNNTPVTIVLQPGVVTNVSAQSISITPNGQTQAQSYNITSDTIVRSLPQRGSIQAISVGEQVVIMTVEGQTPGTNQNAVMITGVPKRIGGAAGTPSPQATTPVASPMPAASPTVPVAAPAPAVSPSPATP